VYPKNSRNSKGYKLRWASLCSLGCNQMSGVGLAKSAFFQETRFNLAQLNEMPQPAGIDIRKNY
jgi:hypothetical protein